MRAPSLRPVPPPRAEGARTSPGGRVPAWSRHFGRGGVDLEHVPAPDLLGDLRVGRMLAGREALAVEDDG